MKYTKEQKKKATSKQSTFLDPQLYTQPHLEQLIAQSIQSTIEWFNVAKRIANGESHASASAPHSRQWAQQRVRKLNGIRSKINKRKLNKFIRQHDLRETLRTLARIALVLIFIAILGKAGHTDMVACEVTKGVICP